MLFLLGLPLTAKQQIHGVSRGPQRQESTVMPELCLANLLVCLSAFSL